MNNHSEYYYPVWLRIWHWLNALLFLLLIFTGINLQYASITAPIIKFKTAILIHNASGILLTLNYLFFFTLNLVTGNIKQYIPSSKNFLSKLIIQARFYLSGIFKKEDHPFETNKHQKFNPLQQITYLKIMYFALPVMIITGWALLFPEFLIKQIFGISGLTLTDLVHTIDGFLLSIFMFGHIYLATTGTTVISNFKAMITGWHQSETHPNSIKEVSNEK